jgi:hypothetical protein
MSAATPGRILAASHDRVQFMFGLIGAIAFARTCSDDDLELLSDRMTLPFHLEGDSPQRKAEADRIAQAYGAVTAYQDGRYRASCAFGAIAVVLEFFPPILAKDAA